MNIEDLDQKFSSLGESMSSSVHAVHPLEWKPRRRNWIKPLVLVACILCLGTTTAVALPAILNHYQKASLGLEIANNNSKMQYFMDSVQDQGITAKLVSVTSGDDKLVVEILYDGIQQKDLAELVNPLFDLQLFDQEQHQYYAHNGYEIIRQPIFRNEDGSYTEFYEINADIEKPTELTLLINRIADVQGSWSFHFNLNGGEAHEYLINRVIPVDGGNIRIEKITIDSMSTTMILVEDGIYLNDYDFQFSSDDEYDEYKNYTGTLTFHGRQYPPTGKADYYQFTMRPFKPNATLNVRIKKNLDNDHVYFADIYLGNE